MAHKVKNRGRVRFGCRIFLRASEPFTAIIERAGLCEKFGFDSVLIDDHLLYGTNSAAAPEPFTTLAAIGLRTSRIRVGVAVTDLIRRHPAIVAQTMATLSSLLPDRTFLGLGTGDPMNRSPFGLSSRHSFSILEEGLRVLKMLWDSSIEKPANYNGRFFSLKRAYLQSGSRAKAPPIYLAAFGKKMLRLAGEQADGWIPHCHTPLTYRTDLDAIRKAARSVGRKLEPFHPTYYTLASTSERAEVADQNVLGPSKYFLALIPEGLKKVDPSVKHPGPIWESASHPKTQREILHRIASTIPDKPALDIAIHGTPSHCIEQIDRYRKSGCKEFMLTFVPKGGLWSTKNLGSMMRFFSARVMNYFRQA